MHIITDTAITIFDDLKPIHTPASHPHFEEIKKLLLAGDTEGALKKVDLVRETVQEAVADTGLHIDSFGAVLYGNRYLPHLLAERIHPLIEGGHPITAFENFCKNLYKNPSYRAITELFDFMEANHLPITDDGCFVAYKKLNHDMKDTHTGKNDNSIGKIVSMERSKVDDNKDRTCSSGLHFASYAYAKGFSSGVLVAVKINPEDVVSIPIDYDRQKGRCCAYKVLKIMEIDELTDQEFYGEDE